MKALIDRIGYILVATSFMLLLYVMGMGIEAAASHSDHSPHIFISDGQSAEQLAILHLRSIN